MTNLSVDQFSAESVTRGYALRWQVERLAHVGHDVEVSVDAFAGG